MNTAWKIILLFTVLLGSVNFSSAADSTLERVRVEFPSAMARLEAFYDHVRGKCRMVQTVAEKDTIRWNISFAADHGLRKGSVLRVDNADPTKQSREKVHVLGAKYYFCVQQSRDKSYLLTRIGSPHGKDAHLNLSKKTCNNDFLFAPCGIWGYPMSALMAEPTFQITSAEEIAGKDQKQIKINYNLDHLDIKSGSIWVIPDNLWSIQRLECHVVMSQGMAKTQLLCDVEYGTPQDGIPTPHRVRYTFNPSGDAPATIRYEIDEIVPGPTPEAEFTLSYYGVPEPGKRKPRRWYAWVGLAGLICVGLAAAFRWKARHAKSAERSLPEGP